MRPIRANLRQVSFRLARHSPAESCKTFRLELFSLGGVRRWQRHLIVQGGQHPFAILLYVNMGEVEYPAEPSACICYPGVLRSKLRSGSFSVQLASHDCAVPIESKLQIRSLIFVPVKFARLNQIGERLEILV